MPVFQQKSVSCSSSRKGHENEGCNNDDPLKRDDETSMLLTSAAAAAAAAGEDHPLHPRRRPPHQYPSGSPLSRRRRRRRRQYWITGFFVCLTILSLLNILRTLSKYVQQPQNYYNEIDNTAVAGTITITNTTTSTSSTDTLFIQPVKQHQPQQQQASVLMVQQLTSTDTTTASQHPKDGSKTSTTTSTTLKTRTRTINRTTTTTAIATSTSTIPPKHNNNNNFISSCLLVMDDNHYLVEWLAYHYTILPLRRLIVAVDPNSKTSPKSILNRYSQRGFINITIWDNDDDYFPKSIREQSKYTTNLHRKHRRRQQEFYLQCMKTLKEEYTTIPLQPRYYDDRNSSSSTTTTIQKKNKVQKQKQQQPPPIWVTFIDTDEFIIVNDRNLSKSKLPSGILPTMYEILTNQQNHLPSPCLPMSRVNIATTEVANYDTNNNNNMEQLEEDEWIPKQFQTNSSSFSSSSSSSRIWKEQNFKTLRYSYFIPKVMNGKALLDLSKVNNNKDNNIDFTIRNVNCHRPLQTYCTSNNVPISHENAIFGVYHYPATIEQYTFRSNDSRNWTRIPEKLYSLNYSIGNDNIISTQNSIGKHWLHNFMNQINTMNDNDGNEVTVVEVAETLLQGVGEVNPQ